MVLSYTLNLGVKVIKDETLEEIADSIWDEA
jgi:hypothetical protein